MIEGYNTEEDIESCLGYLQNNVSLGLPTPRFLGRLEGVGTVGRKIFIDKDFKGVQQAHYSILQHLTIMTPLVNEHLSMIRAESNGRSDDWIMREHKRRLTAWLKDLHLLDGDTVEEQTIKRLVAGPSSQITSWQGYDINGYRWEREKAVPARGTRCLPPRRHPHRPAPRIDAQIAARPHAHGVGAVWRRGARPLHGELGFLVQ